MIRERLSTLAVLPDDVTDPLLWRLAFDVTAAHQPDEHGNCRNLQCAGQRGECAAARTARRAMTLARASRPSTASSEPRRAHGHASVAAVRRPFRGWFATSPAQRQGRAPHEQPLERAAMASAA